MRRSHGAEAMALHEDLGPAYEAFRNGWLSGSPREAPGQGGRQPADCMWLEVSSGGGGYLLSEDQEILENLSFLLPVFLPHSDAVASECLVLGHGFNESEFVKLFPWAYCLCRELQVPVLIFPCAFHINRRPSSWIRLGRTCHHRRKQIPGNRCSSPFNAVASQRISEAPERFLRGALQSYQDLRDLLRLIREGSLEARGPRGRLRPLAHGATPHFLGYSISGYLFLGALLMDVDGWLEESRMVLFNSFTAWDEANPVSVLVVDQEAYQRGTSFYLEGYRKEGSPGFRSLYEDTPEGNRFRQLFLKHGGDRPLSHDVARVRDRLLVIADPHDPIFPGQAIGEHLGREIPTVLLSLGRHEFPFNLPRTDAMGFPQLARAIRGCWAPAPTYKKAFFDWLHLVGWFLKPHVEFPDRWQ